MESFNHKYNNYLNALTKLKEALDIVDPDEVHIDGIIQRFEFTFELAWKTIKEYLEFMGYAEDMVGPRGVLKAAFSEEIIYDGDAWINMMESRNNVSHRYDYEESRKIYEKIKNTYIKLLEDVCTKLKRGE